MLMHRTLGSLVRFFFDDTCPQRDLLQISCLSLPGTNPLLSRSPVTRNLQSHFHTCRGGKNLHFQYTHPFLIHQPGMLRARGTSSWPKIARELTKSDGTWTIRSEIVRGIGLDRSKGPEVDKMKVFDAITSMEVALQVTRTLFWPKVARERTKFNGTRTIRFEIVRGIDCYRS